MASAKPGRPRKKMHPKTEQAARLQRVLGIEDLDEAARVLGVSRTTAANYLRGSGGSPKADALRRVIEATGCNGHWLLTAQGEPFPARVPDAPAPLRSNAERQDRPRPLPVHRPDQGDPAEAAFFVIDRIAANLAMAAARIALIVDELRAADHSGEAVRHFAAGVAAQLGYLWQRAREAIVGDVRHLRIGPATAKGIQRQLALLRHPAAGMQTVANLIARKSGAIDCVALLQCIEGTCRNVSREILALLDLAGRAEAHGR